MKKDVKSFKVVFLPHTLKFRSLEEENWSFLEGRGREG